MSEIYFLFPILFFLQLSWLGILAGILTARSQCYHGNALLTKRNLLITAIQVCASGGLISLMICGHLTNAIIQTLGYIFCFAISLKMVKQRIDQTLTSRAWIKWFIFFLAVIWLWQFLLLLNYASMEWFMIFFILHTVLLIVTSVYKFLLKKRSAKKSKVRNANIGIALCMYLFYVQLTSFATAIAFDCGI
jgi:hypothetical protein